MGLNKTEHWDMMWLPKTAKYLSTFLTIRKMSEKTWENFQVVFHYTYF